MSKMFSKVKDFLGVGNDDDDIGGYDDDRDLEESYERAPEEEENFDDDMELISRGASSSRNNVVSMHQQKGAQTGTKVLITKPASYEESMEICDAVSNRRIVVINTANLENKTARRLLDFVSGASYALKGDFQEIDKGVYILSPSNVEVTNELKSELSTKALFGNWNK